MTASTSKAAAIALLGVVLAGCGGDSTPSAEPSAAPAESETASATPSASASASASASVAPAGALGDFTKQGTELKFGEKAMVPGKTNDIPGTVGVTVTGIMKGDPADLEPLKLGDRVAGSTPYYITVVFTNESGTDLTATSTSGISGVLADGSRAQSVSVIGDFPPCDNEQPPRDFTTKGASFTTCRLALASGSSMVTAVEYAASNDEDFPDTEYPLDPLVWK